MGSDGSRGREERGRAGGLVAEVHVVAAGSSSSRGYRDTAGEVCAAVAALPHIHRPSRACFASSRRGVSVARSREW